MRTLAVVQIFGALLGASYYFLHVQQESVDLKTVFDHHCPAPVLGNPAVPGAGIGAYHPYTGNHELDRIACVLTNFFSIVLTPPLRVATVPLILALPVPWFAVLLDAAALFPNSHTLAIGVPAILGVLMQLKGAGLALPLYWLFSLLSRVRSRAEGRPASRPDNSSITAAMLGITIGVVIPSIAMIFHTTFGVIMLWQFFPFYCAIIQAVSLSFTSSSTSRAQQSAKRNLPDQKAYWTIQTVYLAMAAVAAFGHIPFVRAILSSSYPLARFKEAMAPYPYVFEYSTLEALLSFAARNEFQRFLQWDGIFIGLSAWLAGAWSWAFADVFTFIWAVMCSVFCGAVLGPGALLAYPYMVQSWEDEQGRMEFAHSAGGSEAKKEE